MIEGRRLISRSDKGETMHKNRPRKTPHHSPVILNSIAVNNLKSLYISMKRQFGIKYPRSHFPERHEYIARSILHARCWTRLPDVIWRREHCLISNSLRARLAILAPLNVLCFSLRATRADYIAIGEDADDKFVIGLYSVEIVILPN